MAGPGLIDAYLRELRFSVAKLDDADLIAAEAADHLFEAAARLRAGGADDSAAEAEALAKFGSAALVARVFVEEAKRGGAVSTRVTRLAGMAAMLTVPMLAVGQFGNARIDRGAAHGAAVFLVVASMGAFLFALWGLRRRHGGLGTTGRALSILFVIAPVLALPFGWGAGAALGFMWAGGLALFTVAMMRAGVLPRAPLAALGLPPALAIVGAAILSLAEVDAAPYMIVPFLLLAVGLVWVGWCLWREPALDSKAGPPQALAA